MKCKKCKGYGHETEECKKKNEKRVWRPKEQLKTIETVDQPTRPEPEPAITAINTSVTAMVNKHLPQGKRC